MKNLESFKYKLFVEYPIPVELSIWGSRPGVPAVDDINGLIESAVDEVASDVLMVCYIEATGMITNMPKGTVSIKSAKLSSMFPFQGNRLIKCTFDQGSMKAYLRYYPATICYNRILTVDDLPNLIGDNLLYVKAYILYKMAERELNILKSSNMSVDNGQLDLSTLEDFRDKKRDYYLHMKEEILLYNTVN